MGGKGSGNYIKRGSKPTVETQTSLDLRLMKSKGCLYTGASGAIFWSSGGQLGKKVNFLVERKRLVLEFRYAPCGTNGSEMRKIINFDRTSCNYGGTRMWFRCPGCQRRPPVLYWVGSHFICRLCLGLVYESQQEGETDRLLRRAQRIRAGLGGSSTIFDPFPEKPKRMHHKTYERYRALAGGLEDHIFNLIHRRFGYASCSR